MTDTEICREYRMAKNKKQQITILMDLNGFTREEIVEILAAGGEDVNFSKPPKASKKEEAAMKILGEQKTKREPPKIQIQLPEAVAIALYNQLDQLDQEIIRKEQQYKDIVAFIQGGGKVISCEVNGELCYIQHLRDFADCMDPSVYEALKEFIGGDDITDQNYVREIENLRIKMDDMEWDQQKLQENYEELDEEHDDLKDEHRELEEKFTRMKDLLEKATDSILKILQFADHISNASEALNEIREEMED